VNKPFFSSAKPRLFAHRGLAHHRGLDENTIEAFIEALRFGATHLESDTRATKDQVAVLLHDEHLRRVAGVNAKVFELTLSELQRIPLRSGGRIPTLDSALAEFPDAFFNLDIKTRRAILPTVQAIEKQQAHERVLVSSFSNSVRRSALQALTRPVATSSSVSVALGAWASSKFLFGLGFARIVREVDALQIPPRVGPIRFADQALIRKAQLHGVEVHFWTINDPKEMVRLLALGADGIVTDRVDLFDAEDFL
jgi:glycerophosphoryl diester phosphodiesterase